MPEPLRSPKQSKVAARNRVHPYSRPTNSHRARDAGLSRSNSVLDTIKSFVAAPLAWLSLGDSHESNDSPQKRRMSGSERGGTPPRAKRVRRDSPEPKVGGYLDPPSSLISSLRPPIPVWGNASIVMSARTMSLDPPQLPTDSPGVSLPPSRKRSFLSHTSMSVEPQSQSALRRSTTREYSMPPPSPFSRSYVRSSLTPQPSGATFGPSPKRKARESTAPPLLPSPAPTFTRPPPSQSGQQGIFPTAQSREMSEGPISVLLGHNGKSMSPVRENLHNLLIRDDVTMDRSPSKNKAERTLSALESYRTPLQASRFPSPSPTTEHRPRKVHVPISSKLRFDHTPEGRKEKEKRAPTVVGPYSGMSGMRKLLARRKKELERDAQIESNVDPEKSHDVEVDIEIEERHKDKSKAKFGGVETALVNGRPQVNGASSKVNAQVPRARSPLRSKPDGPYSSLRAPSTRVSRTHAPAPKLKKAKNKFALDDDDDSEWSMSVEDVKKYQAQTAQAQPPLSFSFSRSMSETGMQTDTDSAPVLRAKSPPLPSQPQTFDSLLSRIGPPTSMTAKHATAFPAEAISTFKPEIQAPPQSTELGKTETSFAPASLPFTLGTTASTPVLVDIGTSPFASNAATPAPSPSPAQPSSTPNAVPSFFSNANTQFTPPKVPFGSLFGTEKKEAAEQFKSSFGGIGNSDTNQRAAKPSPFGGVSKPSKFGDNSTSDDSKIGGVDEKARTSAPSPFSGLGTATTGAPGEAKPSLPFNVLAGNDTNASASDISIFGAASKPASAIATTATDASSKPALSFSTAPPLSTSTDEKPDVTTKAGTTPSKGAFSFDAESSTSTLSAKAPNSPFSFGTPAASTQSAANATVGAASSPFSFGAAPSTPPPVDKKSSFTFGNTAGGAPGFSFGSNSLPSGAPNGTTTDAPKPLFGFGSTNTPASNTSVSKTAESTQGGSGDGMEVNGDRMEESPTRTVEKKDDSVSQLPQVPSFAGFGAENINSGFSFGQDKSVSNGGAFSFGQEKPAGAFSFGQPKQSTGGFAFGQTVDKSTTGGSTSAGFGFGQSNNDKPATGESASTSFGFGQSANKPNTAFSFGNNSVSKPPVQSPLSFGPSLSTSFGGGSSSNPTPPSSFSFGQSNTNANGNPFGQSQQSGTGTSSAPSSPSVFPQQTSQSSQTQGPSFSFTTPTSNTFSIPNTAAGPSTTQPFQFGASESTQQQQQQTGATSGATMFTLGGAATPPRKVKGLPTRRARRP